MDSQYKHYWCASLCVEYYDEKMNEAYKMKEQILKLYQPIELHKTIFQNVYFRKIFSDQPNFETIKQKDIISRGYSYNTGNPYKEILIENCKEQYYLYFVIAGFKFHQPTKKEFLDKYRNLPLKNLERNFKVDGREGTELLSAQFCKKVYTIIESKNFIIV